MGILIRFNLLTGALEERLPNRRDSRVECLLTTCRGELKCVGSGEECRAGFGVCRVRFELEVEKAPTQENGLSAEEARYAAHRALGNATLLKENMREVWTAKWFDSLVRDFKYALRLFRKTPGFASVVIFTLALGIGANTAIFSIVNALLLKDLPYAHPERIGTIFARTTGSESSDARRTIDGEQWELLRDNVPSLLSAVSGLRTSGVNLQAGSHVQYLHAGRVSAHYFDVLALHPIVGRNFSEDEDRPHGPRTAILSYALWRTTFGGNPNVLGQAILLKGEPYTIIGVLPENAHTPLDADVYTALQPSREGEGQATNFAAFMRLRDGAAWQQADAEINRALAGSRRAQRFVKTNPGARMTYYSLPLQKGQTDTLRPQVLALMLAAGFILLIACANLAGLTLVRMLRRRGEIATRLALGASRWQIQRQLWIENLLLALVGGAAGIGVGFLALRGLMLLLPEHFLPVATVPLDGRVLGFTLSLSLLTSVLFGMLPALAMRNVDLRSSIPSRGVIGAGSVRLRQGLIAGEVALTVVLLAAAGLLIRTLIHLETMPPGFNPTGVITAKASLDNARYHDPAAFRKLLNDSLGAMREIPGVQNAAVGLTLPYERALLNSVTLSDGKEAGQQVTTNQVYVTPRYFDTLQIPVLAGRAFTDADRPDAQHVVIVNQTFARKFFHGPNPVGRYLNKNMLIVGVVADTVLSSGLRIERRRGALDERGDNLSPRCTTRRCQTSLHRACLDSAKLDCSRRPAVGRFDCADATCPGGRRSQPAFFRLLLYEGPYGCDARDTKDRGRATGCNVIARAIAERGWYLRAGGEHGSAEDARDRHPHCPGLDDSKDDDPYRQDGSGRFGSGIGPGTHPLRASASRFA